MDKTYVVAKLEREIRDNQISLKIIQRLPDGLDIIDGVGSILVVAKYDKRREEVRKLLQEYGWHNYPFCVEEEKDTFVHTEVSRGEYLEGTVRIL